jgi:hypothetical protein
MNFIRFILESPGVGILWTGSRVGKAYEYMSEHDIMSQIESLQIHTLRIRLTDINEWILMLHFLVRKHFKNIFVRVTSGIFGSRDKPLVEALFFCSIQTH